MKIRECPPFDLPGTLVMMRDPSKHNVSASESLSYISGLCECEKHHGCFIRPLHFGADSRVECDHCHCFGTFSYWSRMDYPKLSRESDLKPKENVVIRIPSCSNDREAFGIS
jgi:hypothetical protein